MTSLETLRADFKDVWRHWRNTGQISQQEHMDGYREGSAAIRTHMADPDWMACCCNHFRAMAEQITREAEKAERIKDEVRARRVA